MTQPRRRGVPQRHGRVSAAVLAIVTMAAACRTAAPGGPLLTSVAPTQLSIGGGAAPTVTVRGHGFDKLNTVHFGKLRIPDVPSLNDSTMQFAVPIDDTFLPDRGPAPVQALAGGTYEVRVQTARGTSNPLTISLTAVGAAR